MSDFADPALPLRTSLGRPLSELPETVPPGHERLFVGMYRGENHYVDQKVGVRTMMRPLSDEALQIAIDRAAALADNPLHVMSTHAAGQYQALCDVQLYRAQLLYLPDTEPEDEVTR